MALTVSNIVSIDPEGLGYTNEQGQRRKLLFSSCHQYYVAQAMANPDAFLTWDGYPVDPHDPANYRVVGRHNNSSDVPYYEFFYHDAPVRFTINQKHGLFHNKDKDVEEFLNIEKQINAAGWNTYDAG